MENFKLFTQEAKDAIAKCFAEKLFAEIVMAAFGQRRKTLRNTLRSYLAEADFAQLGIDPQMRAENLGYLEYVKICNQVNGNVGHKAA